MSGWNPITGHDTGNTAPPGAQYGAGPMPGRGQPYIQHYGGPSMYAMPYYGTPYLGSQYTAFGIPQVAIPQMQYGYGQYFGQQPMPYHQNGAGNIYPRQPGAQPAIDVNMPASQMGNTVGGLGCEPGYNYFFPAEHTKAHVYRSTTPPWQLPAGAQMEFIAAHIPVNTTCEELLKGYGCTNENKKKNNCHEIFPSGGGKWYKGLKINGANKDLMKKPIKDLGWDTTRTGLQGDKPVVCLWFSKG